MGPYRIGMRWWLAAAFVVIAALTATLIATVSSSQAKRAVRSSSEDLAVGRTVSAAFAVQHAVAAHNLVRALPLIAGRRDLALFVFDQRGRLVSSTVSNGVSWRSVPSRRAALAAALAGHRFVQTTHASGATVAALPLRRSPTVQALVSYAPRPTAYGRSLAIFRREVVRAAIWAVLAAIGVGVLAAALIVRRLRHIGAAAAAIEQGDFDTELRPRFHDEVGSLALSIDRMRERLRTSFEQLRADRDRLERLFEQLHEGVVAVDRDLLVQFSNTTAQKILGHPTLTPGHPLPELWAGVPLRELARGLFRPDSAIAEARTEADDERTISLLGVPAGASDLAVIVLADITEQQRRERAEREFVANASHELRTPISAILSAVEALQSGAKDSPDDRDAFVDLIGRQAMRLERLIRSLLLLARAQTRQVDLRLEPVALRPLLDDIASSSHSAGGGAIEVDCPAELVALAQRDMAEQVISSLVGNALKHAHSGVVLSARAAQASVVIEVTDRGPGIPHAAQQRIFDRFYSGQQGRREGFGLGLAIVRDTVRTLGGSVEIDSEPGRGTTARVTLAAGPRA
jgi:signal transduction histidine kinase